MTFFTPPPDHVLTPIDHCCACGVPKKEKNKGLCIAWGSLVNKGKHQYQAYLPKKTNMSQKTPEVEEITTNKNEN